jgi:nitroreductase
MKSLIKRLLPARVRRLLSSWKHREEFRREFRVDRQRYARNCAPNDGQATLQLTGRNLEAQLTKDYHRVEKGLALREPKSPFGAEVLNRLEMLIPVAEASGTGKPFVAYSKTAQTALAAWNEGGTIDPIVSSVRNPVDRGMNDIDAFFQTRSSVRDFSPTLVDDSVLNHAVELAINTPSVCNRQSWHVRFFQDKATVGRALSFQNGNRGFADSIPVLALVTVDSRLFAGVGERNQGWIEGGLFSMSLVWALHGLGVDSCMLNMSLTNDRIDGLREEFNIPNHELVVMMIAVGYGSEGHRVARSPHREVGQVKL